MAVKFVGFLVDGNRWCYSDEVALMVLTKLFRVDISNPDVGVLNEVCRDVLNGKIVVFPTETVYGLGASIYRSDALRRIFIAKNRPMDNPLIVHISKKEHLYEIAVDVSSNISKLIDVAWPGPLTLILKKSCSVPLEATAGLSTVAVRMPAHPVAEILVNCTGPIAAPSANISGRPSPVTSHHILVDMFGRADIIIDAGDTIFGIESTIIDVSTEPPRLLRPGAMPIEKIVELLGIDVIVTEVAKGYIEAEEAIAPGMKYRHYAPKTPLILVEGDVDNVIEVIKNIKKEMRIAVLTCRENAGYYHRYVDKVIVVGSKTNLFEVARNLFVVLREIDRMGVDIAISESFPEKGVGLAIMNRLRKASTKIIKAVTGLR
jgi:L-threonylcarbamoyladenylate synthase